MNTITVKNLPFVPLISKEVIQSRLQQVAAKMRENHAEEDVVFIIILKGSLFVAADLIRAYALPSAIEMIRAQSYEEMKSSGVVEISMTNTLDLDDKTVIIIEDIVETGRTLQAVHHHLKSTSPKRLLTFSLLRKPSANKNPIHLDYVGFDIDQEFVIGYGLDYDQEARYLEDIYQLKKSSE